LKHIFKSTIWWTFFIRLYVAQRFAVAGAEAPLLQLPFVPQGVAAKVSDTTILSNV
jgi:hypothetical protein